MTKKNGFIATSLIYSFFLIFITLFLTIIADYLQNKVLLNTIESDIKEEITNSRTIVDFKTNVEKISFENSAFTGSIVCSGVASCNDLSGRLFIITDFKNIDNSEDGKIDTLILKECENNTCSSTKAQEYYVTIYDLKLKIDKTSGMITITEVLS